MNAVTSQLASLFSARHDEPAHSEPVFDGGIVLVAFALMAIGLIIVCSASMPIADRLHDNPFYFAIRHGIYLVGACFAAQVVVPLPVKFWRVVNPLIFFVVSLRPKCWQIFFISDVRGRSGCHTAISKGNF